MPPHKATSFAERYDRSLHDRRHGSLLPGSPIPHPTADWPPENIPFIDRYRTWLLDGGASELVANLYDLPMAGHVLGLTLKTHNQLDPDADLQCAQAYIEAKGLSASWTKNCRNALARLRCFLRAERGLGETRTVAPYDVVAHTQGLPPWLVSELTHYQRIQQRNWRPARLDESIRRFWSGHLRIWRFFCDHQGVQQFADLKRQHILDYMDSRLDSGCAVSGVNGDLYTLQAFLGYLQQEGYPVPQSFLRLKSLKTAETLPKFIPDEQIKQMGEEIERQVARAPLASRRDALLTRAAFYLLWQSGLRLGEVEELRLEDLEIPARRLTVRDGKGRKDRTVYLTDATVAALNDYLAVRGPGVSVQKGPGDHVFLYRHHSLCKDLVRDRIKAVGKQIGVKVYPHRLRHTCATQLLNAGCPITSIQKFLGHKKLDTTLVYAKAHDQTVESDYFAAMQRIEARLDIAPAPMGSPPDSDTATLEVQRTQLLVIAARLAAPEVEAGLRLQLAAQMQAILNRAFAPSPLSFPETFGCEGAGAILEVAAAGP